MVKNFYRKVGFGLSLQDEVPQDPLQWAFDQLDQVPLFTWKGNIFSEKEMREKLHQEVFWGEDLQNLSENCLKFKLF